MKIPSLAAGAAQDWPLADLSYRVGTIVRVVNRDTLYHGHVGTITRVGRYRFGTLYETRFDDGHVDVYFSSEVAPLSGTTVVQDAYAAIAGLREEWHAMVDVLVAEDTLAAPRTEEEFA